MKKKSTYPKSNIKSKQDSDSKLIQLRNGDQTNQ